MQFIMNAPITIDAVINQTTCLETRLKGVYGQKKAHQSKKAQIEQSLVHSSKHEKKKKTQKHPIKSKSCSREWYSCNRYSMQNESYAQMHRIFAARNFVKPRAN